MLGREASYVMDGEYKNPIVVSDGYDTKADIKSIPLKTSEGSYTAAGDIISLPKHKRFPPYRGSKAIMPWSLPPITIWNSTKVKC